MSQSLANIVVHLVFSTKGRRPLIRDAERGQLHAYITGILKNHDSQLIEINSVRDHIHILFAQSKNYAPAKIVEQIKSGSSAWIKTLDPSYSDFAWQKGYGEFSVSPIQVEGVRDYVRKQPNITKRRIFKVSIAGFVRKMANPWMNDMRGIEFIDSIQFFRSYRPGKFFLDKFPALQAGLSQYRLSADKVRWMNKYLGKWILIGGSLLL